MRKVIGITGQRRAAILNGGPGKACNVKGFAFVFKEQQDQCGWNGGNEGQRSRR